MLFYFCLSDDTNYGHYDYDVHVFVFVGVVFFCIIKQTKWKKAHKDSRISIAAECSGVCD